MDGVHRIVLRGPVSRAPRGESAGACRACSRSAGCGPSSHRHRTFPVIPTAHSPLSGFRA